MEVLDPSTWKPLKEAIVFFREAVGLAKDAKNLLNEGPQKDAIAQALSQAEHSAALAEAQIAQSLGYEICRCTFPPQVMLVVGRSARPDKPICKCPRCGNQEPSVEKIRQSEESHRSIEEHNRRARERYERTHGRR